MTEKAPKDRCPARSAHYTIPVPPSFVGSAAIGGCSAGTHSERAERPESGAGLLQAATDRYAAGCPVDLTGAATAELRPPPEHAGKAFHWIKEPGVAPIVAAWNGAVDGWSFFEDEEVYGVGSIALRTFRYLGPAQWKPDDAAYDTPASCPAREHTHVGLAEWKAPETIVGFDPARGQHEPALVVAEWDGQRLQLKEMHVAEAAELRLRITELEAENARLVERNSQLGARNEALEDLTRDLRKLAAPTASLDRRVKGAGNACCASPRWSYATMRCENCGAGWAYDDPSLADEKHRLNIPSRVHDADVPGVVRLPPDCGMSQLVLSARPPWKPGAPAPTTGTAPAAQPGPRKGEFVTCTDGHMICEVMEDIDRGSFRWAEKLGAWRISDPPVIGQPDPRCPCGALWVRSGLGSLHVKGRGWV